MSLTKCTDFIQRAQCTDCVGCFAMSLTKFTDFIFRPTCPMYGFSLIFCHVLYQMYGFYPPSNVPNVRILPCPIPETYFSLWTPAVQRAPCTDAVGDAEASGEGKIFFFRSIRLLIRHAITKIQQKYKYSDFILLRSKKHSKLVTLLTKSSLEQKDSCYINCLTFF